MIDPRVLRAQPERVRKGLQDRSGRYLPQFDEFQKRDEGHRALLKDVEELRAKRNAVSERIGKAKTAKDEEAAKAAMEETAELKARLQEKEAELALSDGGLRELLLGIPNLPHEGSPVGKSETENVERRRGGPEPRRFEFKPQDHQALGEKLGILDPAAAAKLSGSRFVLLKGAGSRLQRALAAFMLDLHTIQHGYSEVSPPYLVRPEILEGTGQLPKFKEDMYRTTSSGEGAGELYLISTSEIPLTNLVRGEILDAARLPLKFAAATPCFRQEAGSYGKDTRGMIRVHQFDKVELVWVTAPEDSMRSLEELTRNAEAVLQALELPYRVVELCTGDLGFASCKTYDLEVWMPSENRYREVSSCSNCWDFQARRMNARFRRGAKAAPEFVHTLNGSGVAVGRVLAALLENFQQADGSIALPQALRKYFPAERIAA